MNKRISILLLAGCVLAGCAKTRLLYDENAYNYPEFDKNYYVEWEDIKDLSISNTVTLSKTPHFSASEGEVQIGDRKIDGYTWGGVKEEQFGYNHNLSKTEKKFSYGITSKLFDGRVRCEGLYQKSRVQLDKTGFAMYFPKSLVSTKYLGFACRGGTDFPSGEEFSHTDLNIDFTWSFYIHLDDGTYNKVSYTLEDVKIPVDNGGNTSFVNFVPGLYQSEFDELQGAVAMSFEWKADDVRLEARNLTDDYSQKEKHHLALMLYEVFIGDSIWY